MRNASTSAAAQAAQRRRPVGQPLRVAGGCLRAPAGGSPASPARCRRCICAFGGRVAVHADQHVLGQHGAVGDVGAVADEAAARDHGRLHGHPAAVDLLVAQHHGVGDEGFVAQRQHVGHHAQRGRDLGVAADLGAQQAVPERRVHGRVDAVQHVQAGFLDLVDQPLARSTCCCAPASGPASGAAGRSSGCRPTAAPCSTISTARPAAPAGSSAPAAAARCPTAAR